MAFSTLAFSNELRMVGCEIWQSGGWNIKSTFNFHPDDPSHPDNMDIPDDVRDAMNIPRKQIAKVKPARDDLRGFVRGDITYFAPDGSPGVLEAIEAVESLRRTAMELLTRA
jgi:hypothetical protein